MGVLYFWLGMIMLLIEAGAAAAISMTVLVTPLRWILGTLGEPVLRVVVVLVIILLMSVFHILTAFIQKKLIGETFWERWKKM